MLRIVRQSTLDNLDSSIELHKRWLRSAWSRVDEGSVELGRKDQEIRKLRGELKDRERYYQHLHDQGDALKVKVAALELESANRGLVKLRPNEVKDLRAELARVQGVNQELEKVLSQPAPINPRLERAAQFLDLFPTLFHA